MEVRVCFGLFFLDMIPNIHEESCSPGDVAAARDVETGPGPGGGPAGSSKRPWGRSSSRCGGLCASLCVGPPGQVPIFIIKATFLRFFGGQALIIEESSHQRKILI